MTTIEEALRKLRAAALAVLKEVESDEPLDGAFKELAALVYDDTPLSLPATTLQEVEEAITKYVHWHDQFHQSCSAVNEQERDTAYVKLLDLVRRYAGEGWRPIESAPKDGRSIILGFQWQDSWKQYIAHWHRGLEEWAEGEGTSSRIYTDNMQSWFTHWQPLPAPPSKDQP